MLGQAVFLVFSINSTGPAELYVRSQVSSVMMFYKIVHQYVALELPSEIVLFKMITRGHNIKYCTPLCRIDVHKNSFFTVYQRICHTHKGQTFGKFYQIS